MKLIFFQNCVSPHQMPYIEALSKRDDVEHVWVIAPRLAYSERAAMGWPETWKNSSDKLTILVAPTDEEVLSVMGQGYSSQSCSGKASKARDWSQEYCFFSGISAFPEVLHWFKLSLGYDLKRGIITEAPYTYDKPLWMHKIRFALKDWKYVKCVDYVFAIGENCAQYYRGWSKNWKVVPFMYCTEEKDARLVISDERLGIGDDNPMKICFVGALDRRKNVSVLMKALSLVKAENVKVTIVGDGPERAVLEEMAGRLNNKISVTFVGAKPMEDTQGIIADNDVLVLPSLHDGWGAVINEAMVLGTVPVCSDKCGAKYIIEKSGFGGVFDVDKPEALAKMIDDFARQIEDLREKREERIRWAEENISPKAVSEYFISSLSK